MCLTLKSIQAMYTLLLHEFHYEFSSTHIANVLNNSLVYLNNS